ncbi:unnamed protein product [Arabidopsis lyrata]|uniref:Carotenoid cleavage dioxygenase 8 n=1 Tax=Arabidopsis lyrata subsp. lyrata TaxID=81972 RepID=D7M9P0_ARALL|nr:carotenoid cleavage dioxygenase 8, chloroplastic [Arabidopsis lyrata subsp. lyrata]EFH45500.1 hypothetical protein ARALYDRAFT_353547 [Arabidopsis lyrata subsp. lyrata]CAH8274554.1 unnamed protein product [Arabidopsis lyrata]|eukprot:XP_002869241.1 carotenoid cleavage dioxygenase 8, chloroplastic [Arabidopsis lyrata subsp. lyrata]
MASLITTKAMMSHHHVLSSTRITIHYSDNSIGQQQLKTKSQVPHRLFARRVFGVTRAVINSPAPSPLPEKEKVEGERRCHVAWTSVPQEKWEGELTVQGKIPTWLNGTYLRNGPGLWNIGDHDFRHLFDGYSTLVKLQFDGGRIFAGHRLLESDAYKAAKKHNRLCYREFSETPKPVIINKNPFSGIGEIVRLFSGESLTDNANTGVIKLGDGRVMCLTETQKGSILVDHETLETIGKFEYDDGLSDHMIQSAHPIVTETEMWTLIPDLVKPGYRVVRMEAGSNKREVVGRVRCRSGSWGPGWVHSFAVTENYVVIPEMPLRYSVRNLLRAEPTPLYKFEWCPEDGAFLHVMSKLTGEVVASVEVPAFVTFHFINAYEEDENGDGKATVIIADCCEHNADTRILDMLRLHTLRSSHGHDVLPDARIGRFRIPLDGSKYGKLETAVEAEKHGRAMDMCSINPLYLGQKYRYVYACGAKRPCNFPNALSKVDIVEKKVKNWHEHGIIPSEPFFVPRPDATHEDDGVVISIVSEENGGSFAILLDGSTFEEIARANFPYGLPYGLHGCWIPKH